MSLGSLPLSRKQVVSIAESRQARISIWAGAVRSGKTIASLIAFLIALTDVIENRKPGLVLIAGWTLQSIERNILDPLQDEAVFGELAAAVEHTPGSNTALILGKTVHLIGASDTRSEARLRGLTACLAMADEATLMSQSFWTQLLARLSVPDARLIATTNPDNPTHWLRKNYILRESELDLKHWHFTLRDNPSLTEKYIADLRAENSGLFYRRRVLGEWCLAEGSVFDMFDPGRHVVNVLPVMKRWLCAGVDYGWRNSFAVVVLGLGIDRRLYFVAEWYWDSSERGSQLADAQYSAKFREFFASVRHPGSQLYGIRPEVVIVDPSAGHFISQLHNDRHLFDGGLSVTGADNAVDAGIGVMMSLLATGRLLVHSSCRHLIEQIQGYSWDEKAAQRGEDKPIKLNDHAVDAARYALYTTRSRWRSLILPPEAPPNYQDRFGVAL
jgi:PBSX family phage terminase large subunit